MIKTNHPETKKSNMPPKTSQSSKIGKRVTCLETPTELVFEIKSARRILPMIGLPIWLSFWCSFGAFISFITHPAFFLFVWAPSALFALYGCLWNFLGKEIITISKEKMIIKWSLFGKGLTNTYSIEKITHIYKNIKKITLFSDNRFYYQFGFPLGSIDFRYNGKIWHVGSDLLHDDVDIILAKMNQYIVLPTKPNRNDSI